MVSRAAAEVPNVDTRGPSMRDELFEPDKNAGEVNERKEARGVLIKA